MRKVTFIPAMPRSVILSTLVLMLVVFSSPAYASVPLCTILDGVTKYKGFTLPASSSMNQQDTAIVLSVLGRDDPKMEHFVHLNVEYKRSNGEAGTISGKNVISISDAAPDTEIAVDVGAFTDEFVAPLTYSFVSFYANFPICFLPISPVAPFKAILPSSVNTLLGTQPAFSYYYVWVPREYSAVKITIVGNPAPAASIVVIHNLDGTQHTESRYVSGNVIPASGPFYFAYCPGYTQEHLGIPINFEVEISVQYVKSGHFSPTLPPSASTPMVRDKGRGFLFYCKIILIIFFVWFFASAFYNYSTLGERHFPYMFPFGERVAVYLSAYGVCEPQRQDYRDIEMTRI